MADVTRRTVLAGLGATSAAAALVGCSTYGNKTTPTSTKSASAASSGGPVDLGSSSAIPVGGGKVFADQRVVVTQPTAGTFKCFTAICTHLGCTVNTVTDGTINCPCHGSKYNITNGSVVNGPAPKPLAAEQITVTGGEITLNS